MFSSHRCQEGDTLHSLARAYNVPLPILEAMNTHLPAANPITPGSVVHIPRMDTMFCQKVYWEQPVPASYSSPTIPRIGPRYNRPSASYNGFYSC
ncbi:LysM domain-containing protein [Paenibacillus sp. RC67]|uniref:LysM peptidoglycan-binding domain-containing protein n=1 Tax=Paenibacillus sp. RC67 TaxID=3039392 RepID=UPI0024AE388E|nr:LysM domain-containing protein [Paenibacillus sp. RC67]